MYACCERAGEPMPSMAFRYHGKRINKYQTPLQLDMNDNDVIDAFGVHLLTPSPMCASTCVCCVFMWLSSWEPAVPLGGVKTL